ncbi:MAG: DUF1858 domain-containing protein [Nanoarchaeota archaeon]
MEKKTEEKITKEMSIGQIVHKYPETFHIFQNHGMHCMGCAVAQFENIEQGCIAHGIDTDKLVKDLNESIKKKK